MKDIKISIIDICYTGLPKYSSKTEIEIWVNMCRKRGFCLPVFSVIIIVLNPNYEV